MMCHASELSLAIVCFTLFPQHDAPPDSPVSVGRLTEIPNDPPHPPPAMSHPEEPQNPRGAHVTAAADRVPLGIKIGYACGGMSFNLMVNSIANLAQFVLTVALGVNPAMVGLVLSLPRLVDAFTDPIMGGISDNFRSRYGRRKPFMVVGGIGAGLTFALLWMIPHGWSGNAYFWWFLIVSLIFYLFTTVFGVPWSALGFSLTADYDERTRLMAFNSFWCSVALLSIPWLYAATQMPSPPRMRAAASSPALDASPDQTAETKNSTAQTISERLRPRASLIQPAGQAPATLPSKALDTVQPSARSESWKRACRNSTVPAITAVS